MAITNKFDWNGVILAILGIVFIGALVFVVVTLYDNKLDEQMCVAKGGVVVKDRGGVLCAKSDMFIQLR